MAVTRSGDAGSLVVATCALFDTRVFVWTITAAQAAAAAAAAAAARGAAAAAGDGAAADADGAAERLAARRAACWDPAAAAAYEAASLVAGDAAAPAAAPAAPAPAGAAAAGGGGDRPAAAGAGAGAGGGSQAAPELRHAFTTPDLEPVVDLSISTAGHRLFIIGMESVRWRAGGQGLCLWMVEAARLRLAPPPPPHARLPSRPPPSSAPNAAQPLSTSPRCCDQIFVADLCGAPYLRVSTLAWRGLVPPGAAHGPADVGAFRRARRPDASRACPSRQPRPPQAGQSSCRRRKGCAGTRGPRLARPRGPAAPLSRPLPAPPAPAPPQLAAAQPRRHRLLPGCHQLAVHRGAGGERWQPGARSLPV